MVRRVALALGLLAALPMAQAAAAQAPASDQATVRQKAAKALLYHATINSRTMMRFKKGVEAPVTDVYAEQPCKTALFVDNKRVATIYWDEVKVELAGETVVLRGDPDVTLVPTGPKAAEARAGLVEASKTLVASCRSSGDSWF